ncbi:MAG: ABC transporter substrate-binding protein, partial [Rhizobiaceae bacterium]|nr:ABC transporter substrate-binding protein [Rhizobiaceae bacterium]
MFRFRLLATTAALALATGIAGAQELVIGADVDAGTLDPRLARDTTAYRTVNLIYSGLVHLTPDLEPVPDLAESWDSPDPNTIVFTLRDGLKFSNGSALTAEDVVFTFETILNPDFSAPQRGLFTPIKSVEAVDERTVRFNLTTPYAPLLSYLDMGIVPSDYDGDLATSPVGAGPMVLSNWNRGAEIELAASDSYWAGAPAVKEVTLRIVGDNAARAQAFEAGDLDVIQSPLSPGDIKRLAADDSYGSTLMAGLGVTYLNMNANKPLLADPAMRRAFAMLADQSTIVGAIYEGVDEVASSVILPSSWAYDASITQPTFNVDAARAAFGELGWSDSDGDGVLDRDGQKLSVTLATHSEDPNRIQAVEFLQATMQQAGVDA